jgi:hypothetical protein
MVPLQSAESTLLPAQLLLLLPLPLPLRPCELPGACNALNVEADLLRAAVDAATAARTAAAAAIAAMKPLSACARPGS